MTLYPNCKINIGLRVVGKRSDGYHNIETIFYPIHDLHDRLDIEVADTFSFGQTGLSVDCKAEDNLIIRCYRLMQKHYPQIGNVRIRFHKNIPFGAGLGGGSSDAAHTALALNQLFNLGLSQQQLADLVRTLGADCPFFIYNTPCYAEGVGDILRPVSLPVSGMRIILLKPYISVSTRDAYSGIHCHPSAAGQIDAALRSLEPLATMLPLLINDFEETVFARYPELGEIKQRLKDAGALYAAMSGSGSTLYALFDKDDNKELPAPLKSLQILNTKL